MRFVILIGLFIAGCAATAGADEKEPVRTPLHEAAREGKLAAVEEAIRQGAEVDARDEHGLTPLYLAAARGHVEVVKLLLQRGAGVEIGDKDAHTPLYRASSNGHLECARLLVGAKADVNAKCKSGDTPIYWAVYSGHQKVVELLIRHGADVNVLPPPVEPSYPKDRKPGWVGVGGGGRKETRAPLHVAARFDNIEMMRLLLRSGAKVELKGNDGFTPLHVAAARGTRRAAELLLEHSADVNARTKQGQTPLFFSLGGFTYHHDDVAKKKTDLAKHLIRRGADVAAKDKHGDMPLHAAAGTGYLPAVELLLAKGVEVDPRGREGDTPLHRTILWSFEVMKRLVAAGADVRAKNDDGTTPLHKAAWCDLDGARVLFLIDRGAAVAATDKAGATPLHVAARRGAPPIVEILIRKGADVNAKTKEGATPLSWAMANGKAQNARVLERHGAKLVRPRMTPAQFEAKHNDKLGERLLHIKGRAAKLFVAIDPRWLVVEGMVGREPVETMMKEAIDEVVVWKLKGQDAVAVGAPFVAGSVLESYVEADRIEKFRQLEEAVGVIRKEGTGADATKALFRKIVKAYFAQEPGDEMPAERVTECVERILERARALEKGDKEVDG